MWIQRDSRVTERRQIASIVASLALWNCSLPLKAVGYVLSSGLKFDDGDRVFRKLVSERRPYRVNRRLATRPCPDDNSDPDHRVSTVVVWKNLPRCAPATVIFRFLAVARREDDCGAPPVS